MTKYVDPAVLGNVFVVALVAGVGITALFAVGVRALDRADEGVASGRNATGQRVFGFAALAAVAVFVIIGVWAVLAK
jgi:hypothetical protein